MFWCREDLSKTIPAASIWGIVPSSSFQKNFLDNYNLTSFNLFTCILSHFLKIVNSSLRKVSRNPYPCVAVYVTQGYGFLRLPRDGLIEKNSFFRNRAWLDLWCYTTFDDCGNAFSFLEATIEFGKYSSVQSMEIHGKQLDWENT